ncbi:MAG: phospholipase D-like domain-containing protein [bacterium]
MNRGTNAPAKNIKKLRADIGTPKHRIRQRLTKELLPTLRELLCLTQKNGGTCYAALYELTDRELICDLENTPGTQLVLSNANSSKKVGGKQTMVYDGTNAQSRKRLRANDNIYLIDRMLKGNSIGHNKFIVYEDAQRQIRSVLTGSTNWTPTGLCGQTNNAILIDDKVIASHYLEYWKRLRNEQVQLQGQKLRTWAHKNPKEVSLGPGAGSLKVWFSPNTRRKTKNSSEVPVDLAEVYKIIEGAQKVILFLLFNPGTPSIIDKVKEVAAARAKEGKTLFVRGAISDAKTADKAGTVRVFSRSVQKRSNIVITGVAGIPDDFGYWEKELLKLGHAAIHDKVLVVDPFLEDCAVVTGSHNLGFKASYANDENLVIIRRNQQVAEAFATHVLDVVNHYKWRYKLQKLYRKEKNLDKAWQDLCDTNKWQNKYFNTRFLESRDQFVFS